ncbi:class D sortase [Ureibacillus terrenus]|uniref:class D sortase n=1 Tax=Ureibacillus terrenus TaxID=118246 RepID=UPI002E1A2C9C|nr:class D sortase [Ureibacillus terrenus]
MKRKIGNLFLLAGLALLLFVAYTKIKIYYEQQKLMKEFESLDFAASEEDLENRTFKDGEMIGQLYIPKIDLTTPIVEGASDENMKSAVTHMTNSSPVSKLGDKNSNFAIAGHRTATFGKFFNRLDEMEKGDEFYIETPTKKYTFIVIQTQIIKPTQVEVILPVKDKALVTLITCHPIYSNKYRLIVTGEFKEVTKKKKEVTKN